ncbi:hypothetical protein HRbin26_01548 [bacterium HR26]|nr:hypothetical protein HRbin26_01548 [bacterium HR26]
MLHARSRNDRSRPGQSLVEFALLATTLVLMLGLAVDGARAFSAWIVMGNMARAAAQYGTIGPILDPAVDQEDEIEAGMKAAAEAELNDQLLAFVFNGTAGPDVEAELIENDPDTVVGDCAARAMVSYDFEPLFIPVFPGFEIQRQATMRIQYVPPGFECPL